jgi:DNA-directed RNA polymerase beta subunit
MLQRRKYLSFVENLPSLVQRTLGVEVTIDPRASIMEANGKRYVTPYECEVCGLTYAFMVVVKCAKPYVLMQVPKMLDDGTFLVRGKRRVVMLRRQRARVPVMLGKGVMAIGGGKLDLEKRMYTPSFAVHAVPIAKARKWSPRALKLACEKGEAFAFDPNDIANMRLLTVDILLEKLVTQVLRTTKAKGVWPEQHVTVAIFSAMSTGNWRGTSMQGVTQLANMGNRTSLRSQMSDVVSVYTSMQARFVHPSTHGYFCVSQTPEGQKVGLVHQLVEGVDTSEETDVPAVHAGPLPWFHNGELQDDTVSPESGSVHCGTVWTWSDAGRMTHPGGMLGCSARQIPFLEHNQGPRISYYCSMAKQAMGDTGQHQLLYAQRPLVTPCHEATEGCNVILAVNCMGYNQEDALVVSKGALERGLFRSIQWNTYTAKVDSIDHIAVGQQVAAGEEVMVGTYAAKRGASQSTVVEAAEAPGISRVKTAALRMPVTGDKLCNRHGQKGVIGAIIPDEDMPYTQEGIRPDLVINAHAFPSRMTVGQIMEMAGGKLGGVDGTPFSNCSVQDLYKRGGSGRETMYDGRTGLPLKERIFIAPCWYQRLHHLAQDKCYARGASGLTDRLTNQPTAGRKNEGGMRLGEMERDVLVGSGATQALRERMDCIGTTTWDTCAKCGKHFCQHIFCGRKDPMTVPHATKLLGMELAAMGIEMTLE